MKNISKIKRDFLASLPVIGPHVSIEAELMLAGTKPITMYPIFECDTQTDNLSLLKEAQDLKKLNEAAANGQLRTLDTKSIKPPNPDAPSFKLRYFCQPEEEETMQMMVRAENTRDFSELKKDFGRYLGYRKRDVAFFHAKRALANSFPSLTEQIHVTLNNINAPCQVALGRKLLEEAGIPNPDEYLADIFKDLKPEEPSAP